MRPSLVLILLAAASLSAAAQPTPDYDAAAQSVRKLLGELVAADTSNPPGNEARAVAIGAARLKQAGIEPEVSEFAPGRQNLVARLKGDGSARPLLLLAHIDVVGAAGQAWSTDPHKMTEVDGYLVGRGVADDLGMAAMSLELLLMLKRSNVPLRRDVILAWTGDEESGGAGIIWLLEHKKASIDAALAINEGGSPVLDEQGKVVRLAMQAAEKIYQDFEITAKGTTGHSSVPLEDNAIVRLARGLAKLGDHRFPARLLPVTRAYYEARAELEKPELAAMMRKLVAAQDELPADALAALEADPAIRADLRTTCVATLLSGGTRVNALPAEAKANVNCRILPDETPADVRRQLAEVLGDPALEIRPVGSFGSAGPSPLDGPGPEAIRKVAAEMWPGVPVIPTMSRGATDSRFLRQAGIPAYGMRPIAATEEDSRRAHGIDERIAIASLRPGLEFYHRLVLDLAAKR
jgi:acetylornithine deacetylase/succinyl-diaminopimelate desuccinylase-like protein